MATRSQYVKRTTVVAVRLALETDGFTYRKWGGVQRCKAGDWIVNNRGDRADTEGDTYTVDADSFARTYREVSHGIYRKVTPVWAEKAAAAGRVATKEGSTGYQAGDYLVSNGPEGQDSYAVTAAEFEATYQRAD
jgi:hypothetical protein